MNMLKVQSATIIPDATAISADIASAIATDATTPDTVAAVQINPPIAIYRTVRKAIITSFESLCHFGQEGFCGVVSMGRVIRNVVIGFTVSSLNR